MLKIETEDGVVWLDQDRCKLKPEGDWVEITGHSTPRIGSNLYVVYPDGSYDATSTITKVTQEK